MAKGGARPGAGRKKGEPNKRTAEVAQAMAKSGLLPLDYALEILRDTTASKADRMWACEKTLPFIHPRLQAQVNPLDPSKPPVTRLEVEIVGPH